MPWKPDVILLLDVLEHLPGKEHDIQKVMSQCNNLISDQGVVLTTVPQLYRLDRLKLQHLHYTEHQVRFTLDEWYDIISEVININDIHGIGYLSCLPYLPMISPWYKDDNFHGKLFHFLRDYVFEWDPLKQVDTIITHSFGKLRLLNRWSDSTLFVCNGGSERG